MIALIVVFGCGLVLAGYFMSRVVADALKLRENHFFRREPNWFAALCAAVVVITIIVLVGLVKWSWRQW